MSNKDERLPGEDEIAAEVHARINRTLSNPKLQARLEELRALTPPGEPMFGFKLQAADVRAEVPKAEHVEPEDGQAIVADKDAAAAYVEGAVPAAGPLPRMPTGRVRLSPDARAGTAAPNANTAADADTRRQVTQPSIRKGGYGPPPPRLAEEETETTPTPTGGPTVKPAHGPGPAVTTAPASSRREPSRWRGWIAVTGGLLFAAILVGLALRAPQKSPAPATTSTTATSSPAPAPTAPSATSSTASAPPVTAAPSAPEAPSSAPTSSPPSTNSAAPSAAPRPRGAATVTTAPPATTSTPSTAPSAPTAEPSATTTPTATAAPSAPPTHAPTAPPSSSTPQPASTKQGRRIAETDDEK